jgi:VWFA-related protein
MKKYLSAPWLLLVLCLFVSAQEPSPLPAPAPTPEAVPVSAPISVGIVVDNSGSFRLILEYVVKTTQAVSKLVETNDEGFLVRFVNADNIHLLQDFTGSQSQLVSATDEMYIEGGSTAISEALMFSAKHLIENGKNEKKILILISDGDNKSDKKTQTETLKFLKDNNVSVFVIGITIVLDERLKESQKFLEKLASETGGSLVNVDKKMGSADAAKALIKTVRAAGTSNNGK